MKRRNIVVANWKMNPALLSEAKNLFTSIKKTASVLKNTDVVVAAPVIYLESLGKNKLPKNLFLAAQNIAIEEKGAYTGEVSAEMIKNLSVQYSIVGHSERRYPKIGEGETDELVNIKIKRALFADVTPVICIGERARDMEGAYLSFIKEQIKNNFSGLSKKDMVGLIIAYEPVWAIGKSYRESMSSTDMHEMVLFIRKVFGEMYGKDLALSLRILYGGSVERENAEDMIKNGEVDGFLVGHASLDQKEFANILKSADIRK